MANNVSDRLQAALERLDQTIDRLDASLTEHLELAAAHSKAGPPAVAAPHIAERLDRMCWCWRG